MGSFCLKIYTNNNMIKTFQMMMKYVLKKMIKNNLVIIIVKFKKRIY